MDAVGAANILNRRLNSGGIVPGAVVPCGGAKYLRPADLRRRRSRLGRWPKLPWRFRAGAGRLFGGEGPCPAPRACV